MLDKHCRGHRHTLNGSEAGRKKPPPYRDSRLRSPSDIHINRHILTIAAPDRVYDASLATLGTRCCVSVSRRLQSSAAHALGSIDVCLLKYYKLILPTLSVCLAKTGLRNLQHPSTSKVLSFSFTCTPFTLALHLRLQIRAMQPLDCQALLYRTDFKFVGEIKHQRQRHRHSD